MNKEEYLTEELFEINKKMLKEKIKQIELKLRMYL